MLSYLIQKSELITIGSGMIHQVEIHLEDSLVEDLTSTLKTFLEEISSLDSSEGAEEEEADAESEEDRIFSFDTVLIWRQ